MAVEIPHGEQARKAWRALGPSMRLRLALRALRGRGASDVRVAAVAVGWARLTLATPTWQFLLPTWIGLLAGFALLFIASQLLDLDPILWQLGLFILLVPGPPSPLLIPWQARMIERANLPIIRG
jgi:hypothetical protein